MIEFCGVQTCRRKYLLTYFGEDWPQDNCAGCDVCLTPREEFDATLIAQKSCRQWCVRASASASPT